MTTDKKTEKTRYEYCLVCTNPLKGRQTHYCSRVCRGKALWLEDHPNRSQARSEYMKAVWAAAKEATAVKESGTKGVN